MFLSNYKVLQNCCEQFHRREQTPNFMFNKMMGLWGLGILLNQTFCITSISVVLECPIKFQRSSSDKKKGLQDRSLEVIKVWLPHITNIDKKYWIWSHNLVCLYWQSPIPTIFTSQGWWYAPLLIALREEERIVTLG